MAHACPTAIGPLRNLDLTHHTDYRPHNIRQRHTTTESTRITTALQPSCPSTPGLSLTQKKKKSRPERGNFKRARGQYMSSPQCSQLFNHESLAPNWSQHITI